MTNFLALKSSYFIPARTESSKFMISIPGLQARWTPQRARILEVLRIGRSAPSKPVQFQLKPTAISAAVKTYPVMTPCKRGGGLCVCVFSSDAPSACVWPRLGVLTRAWRWSGPLLAPGRRGVARGRELRSGRRVSPPLAPSRPGGGGAEQRRHLAADRSALLKGGCRRPSPPAGRGGAPAAPERAPFSQGLSYPPRG